MNKQQLAAKIWASANRMRSKIEPNEYKDYILGFIFYKYLSDKEEQYLLSQDYAPNDIKEYVNEDDEETVQTTQQKLGYFIAYKDLFPLGFSWVRILRWIMSVQRYLRLPALFILRIKRFLLAFLTLWKLAYLNWAKIQTPRRRQCGIWCS